MARSDFRSPTKMEKDYPLIILPEEKDKIVSALMSKNKSRFPFGFKDVPDLKISRDQFEKVIRELESMGLLENSNCEDGGVKTLNSRLDEFYRMGGFRMQEEIILANFRKLDLEIENLKKVANPSLLDRINNISSIVNTVFSAIQTTMSLKTPY